MIIFNPHGKDTQVENEDVCCTGVHCTGVCCTGVCCTGVCCTGVRCTGVRCTGVCCTGVRLSPKMSLWPLHAWIKSVLYLNCVNEYLTYAAYLLPNLTLIVDTNETQRQYFRNNIWHITK